MKKTQFLFPILFFCTFNLAAQFHNYFTPNNVPFYTKNTEWADSILQKMTVDERIGQLFMVATYSTADKRNNKALIDNLIKKYHIGGLIFMQGTPEKQVQLINHYQAISKTPLFIGMDLENGLAFRLKNTVSFPKNMTLGAIENEKLIYETAREIGKQCKRIGVHINFAPVLDINNNRHNPIIGVRSFGENKENVVSKAEAFVKGLQDEKIIAVGKHFPGHGDTQIDSHLNLPHLNFDFTRLDSLELYPFRKLSNYGIAGMMSAHLQVPAIDKKYPTSLSYKAVTELLQNQIGFKGLIFTDALNMGGVANQHKTGDVDVLALLAGNDVLLFSQNVPKAIKKIKQALQKGKITQEEIDKHVRKILLAKNWVGLDNFSPLATTNLNKDLHSKNTEVLQEKLAKAAVTLVKNENDIIPIKDLHKQKIAVVSIGGKAPFTFEKRLAHYTPIKIFKIAKNSPKSQYDKLHDQLAEYTTIIIAKHNISYRAKRRFGATTTSDKFISELAIRQNVIFTFFGSPYGVSYYDLTNCKGVLVAYQDSKYFQEAAAQAIFGGNALTGKLSFGINEMYPAGWGLETAKNRLGYALPETENANSNTLKSADSIINNAIKHRAMPSCQLLIAKNGNIIYNKAYGYHTFAKKRAVKTSDIYDLASVTKVSATLPMVMQEYENGLLSLDSKLGKLLPYFKNTDKAKITVEDLLTHESGLPSWIPLYRLLINPKSYGKKLISYRRNKSYTIQIDKRAWLYRNFRYKKGLFNKSNGIPVGKNLFLNKSVTNILFDTIANCERKNGKKKYRYSDLGFMLIGEYLKSKENFKDNLQVFFKQLGAKTTGMQPWQKFPTKKLLPTSKERFLRKTILRGYVHDPNAALLGGVAGHAGLFSNAEDLAKIWQMYLQGGSYGDKQFLSPETISLFTAQRHPEISRRGLGFDKPDADTTKTTSFTKYLPLSSFGHTGFTGTMVWADPENQLIGIILTNRVYPNDWNKKLGRMDIRTKLQEVIYKSIK